MSRIAERIISSDDYTNPFDTLIAGLGMATVLSTSQGGTGQDTSAKTGLVMLTDGTWNFIDTVVDVAGYKTGGAGTVASPWTGWDTAITWQAGYLYVFRDGYYSYSTAPSWGVATLQLLGMGRPVLSFTGTGNAVSLDGGATGSGVMGLRMENFVIQGTATATNGIYMRSVHHSLLRNLRVTNVATAGLSMAWCVANHVEHFRVSSNEGAFTTQPTHGIVLQQRGTGLECVANLFTNPILEGVSSTGIRFLNGTSRNTILGGVSESNAIGVEIATPSDCNVIVGMDCESNATADLLIGGAKNNIYGGNFNGTVHIAGAGVANQNLLCGGQYNTITIDATSSYTRLVSVFYGSAGGTLTDNGTKTQYVGVMNLTGPVLLSDKVTTLATGRWSPTYGAAVAIDASNGAVQVIEVTDTSAFTIGAPTNPVTGQDMTIVIYNHSGGSVGTITWNAAFKMAAFTNPANNTMRSVTFQYDGSYWRELTRTTADVPA